MVRKCDGRGDGVVGSALACNGVSDSVGGNCECTYVRSRCEIVFNRDRGKNIRRTGAAVGKPTLTKPFSKITRPDSTNTPVLARYSIISQKACMVSCSRTTDPATPRTSRREWTKKSKTFRRLKSGCSARRQFHAQ